MHISGEGEWVVNVAETPYMDEWLAVSLGRNGLVKEGIDSNGRKSFPRTESKNRLDNWEVPCLEHGQRKVALPRSAVAGAVPNLRNQECRVETRGGEVC